MTVPFELARFEEAQQAVFDRALAEIRQGQKCSHWMWFMFPQMRGLGSSTLAHKYGISSLEEARAYLAHQVLGPRLTAAVSALQDLSGCTAESVFGSVDAMKLRSSLTLFHRAGGGPLFEAALQRWFGGEPDAATLKLLAAS
jgi:uncharacterized protein (DUF1810 family)